MLRPAIGCSTFMVFDFIRVPPPAARTMTVTGPWTGSLVVLTFEEAIPAVVHVPAKVSR